jgi:predicted ATPase
VTRGESLLTRNLEDFRQGLSIVFPGHAAETRTFEELVKLKIHNKETSKYASSDQSDTISDVGFGFSQVFPILVQAAVMPPGSLLIVEQPELHLHPLAQTRLASFIANCALGGKRFLIETHSEHFVRGMQLAVSRGRDSKPGFKKEMVSFNYLERAPKSITDLLLNEFGEFVTEWPNGFFDESYRSLRQIIDNKMKG